MTDAELRSFWARTFDEASRVPLDAHVEPLRQPVPYEVFRVAYRSVGGVPIRAYLSLPISGERPPRPWPAIVTAPGYGGSEFGAELPECQRGCVVLQVFPRGQGEGGELWKVDAASERNWLANGKHDKESFYYRGAYMDLVRAVDFLATRDDVDPNRIGAMGTSQGGGLVLALGALDPRVKAVVAHVPFLCDFRDHPGSIVAELAKDPRFLETFDWFDPVNLATWIHAPTLLSSGGKDATCPPEAIRAVFDQLPGIKAIAHYPELMHTTSIDFYQISWEWIERYLMRA